MMLWQEKLELATMYGLALLLELTPLPLLASALLELTPFPLLASVLLELTPPPPSWPRCY